MAAESFRGVFGTNLFPRRSSQPTRLGFSPRPRHFPFAFASLIYRALYPASRHDPHETPAGPV
jgi:hypothetical protein